MSIVLEENTETLIRIASEQAKYARSVDLGQISSTNDSVDGTFLCMEHSLPGNNADSRLRTEVVNHTKFGLVMDVAVFESAGVVANVKVPSTHPDHVTSWVRNFKWCNAMFISDYPRCL